MTDYKIGLCDKCKDEKGIVCCNPLTCECDCHFEVDELLTDVILKSRGKK